MYSINKINVFVAPKPKGHTRSSGVTFLWVANRTRTLSPFSAAAVPLKVNSRSDTFTLRF